MAACRHNKPTIIVYGGTIQPGVREVDCPALGYKAGDSVQIGDGKREVISRDAVCADNILSAFESYGAFITGKIGEEERVDVVRHACPGSGACGGM